MPKKTRRKYTAEQKAAVVRRHLVDKVPVSDLCDEYGIQPSMFYTWQKTVMDNAERTFVTESQHQNRSTREAELEKKIVHLEAKLARKDSIIADISEEYVTLKKELGDP